MKWFVISTFFLLCFASCSTPDQNNEQDQAQKPAADDTTPQRKQSNDNSFDLNNFQELVDRYEDPKRAEWQNPTYIIEKLGDIKGKTIADIGAGTGYFTFRLAQEGAKVIAIDIDERFLDYIENRKEELIDAIPLTQIETRLAKEDDPMLTQNEADIALLVNTYHFIDNRTSYLNKLAKGVDNNGRIYIVDYKKEDIPIGPAQEHKIAQTTVVDEVQKAGLEILDIDNKSLKYQYIITARKK
ncbi:MAG: methyltransferase domain-containing protein [Fulvivirga sp.]|nr:methyltransferase domain-containing protein [Fulvivirga sp.]